MKGLETVWVLVDFHSYIEYLIGKSTIAVRLLSYPDSDFGLYGRSSQA